MKKDILSWNDVKERYLEFHKMDSFTENMAIDIDFGYWLVNKCIIPDVSGSVCSCEMPAKVKGKNECWRCKKPFKEFLQTER